MMKSLDECFWSSVLSNWFLYDGLVLNTAIFNKHISRDSVATYLGCGEIVNTHFTTDLLTYLTVKEFRKSVKIWLSYCHEFGVSFLEHGLY